MDRNLDQQLVSIITPAFNCEVFIGECMASVLAQTYTNWEMLIVNDQSTDRTAAVVERYVKLDPRIRLITLEVNSGAAVARNTALKQAHGRFIAFLDSDDRWKPNKLTRQLEFMIQHGYGFTCSAYEYILDHESIKPRVFSVPEKIDYQRALTHRDIGCLTVMLDLAIVGEVQMPLVRRAQDHLTWVMIIKRGFPAYGLNECLAEYRKVQGSISHNKVKAIRRQWDNYRKVLGIPLLPCLYYYTLFALNSIKKHYFS